MTVSVGPNLSDALKKSPILSGDDNGMGMGSGFDFIDANQDPDLALALRVSLEEQRQRQEEENKAGGDAGGGVTETPMASLGDNVDLSQLSEEEQIALAMQMSLAVNSLTFDSFIIRSTNCTTNFSTNTPNPRELKKRCPQQSPQQ